MPSGAPEPRRDQRWCNHKRTDGIRFAGLLRGVGAPHTNQMTLSPLSLRPLARDTQFLVCLFKQ